MATALRITTCSILVALLQWHFLIVSPCVSCTYPWTSFGNHCYLLVMDATTFDEAEQHCQGLSRHGRPSHLASIMSQEEDDFLVLLIKSKSDEGGKKIWFGYRKEQSGGSLTWRFVDGSPSGGYSGWNTNNPSGDGDCAEINLISNGWNDLRCDWLRGFVCKVPARF